MAPEPTGCRSGDSPFARAARSGTASCRVLSHEDRMDVGLTADCERMADPSDLMADLHAELSAAVGAD